MKCVIAGLILSALCVPRASAGTLLPGEALQATFVTTPSPNCILGPCDSLIFELDATGATGTPVLTAQLFNASILLGAWEYAGVSDPVFESSASMFGSSAAIVDFASILDGTISGILDLSIVGGTLSFNPDPTQSHFHLGYSNGPDTIVGGSDIPLTSLVIAPEALTAVLWFGGLIVLAAMAMNSRRLQKARLPGVHTSSVYYSPSQFK